MPAVVRTRMLTTMLRRRRFKNSRIARPPRSKPVTKTRAETEAIAARVGEVVAAAQAGIELVGQEIGDAGADMAPGIIERNGISLHALRWNIRPADTAADPPAVARPPAGIEAEDERVDAAIVAFDRRAGVVRVGAQPDIGAGQIELHRAERCSRQEKGRDARRDVVAVDLREKTARAIEEGVLAAAKAILERDAEGEERQHEGACCRADQPLLCIAV